MVVAVVVKFWVCVVVVSRVVGGGFGVLVADGEDGFVVEVEDGGSAVVGQRPWIPGRRPHGGVGC